MYPLYNTTHLWINAFFPVLVLAECIVILIICRINKIRFKGHSFFLIGTISFFLYKLTSLLATFGLFVIPVMIEKTPGFQLNPIIYLVNYYLYSIVWLSFGIGGYLLYIDKIRSKTM
jgi:hypothetical protein